MLNSIIAKQALKDNELIESILEFSIHSKLMYNELFPHQRKSTIFTPHTY